MTLFSEALDQFEEAARDYAFRGTKMPQEWPEIERRYAAKRQALIDYVEGINVERAAGPKKHLAKRNGGRTWCGKPVNAVDAGSFAAQTTCLSCLKAFDANWARM